MVASQRELSGHRRPQAVAGQGGSVLRAVGPAGVRCRRLAQPPGRV